jgi:type IV pilus assembly protein PilW
MTMPPASTLRAFNRSRPGPRGTRGMTLIEILVALALGMLVMGAVALVFAATSRNRGDLERSARLTQNAQYALDFLADEVRLAGYFAEMSFVGVTWQTPDPCATVLSLQGWSAAPFTAPVGTMGYRPGDALPACLPNHRDGTAVLVLRRASVDTTPPASASGGAYLQVSKCAADLQRWIVSSQPSDFKLRNLDCNTIAEVRPLLVRTYYVADCDDCGHDTIPTLKRAELQGDRIVVTPLVEGVENLQLAYGFDGDGDGDPDRWLDAPDASIAPAFGEWSNVLAVRLYALVRAGESQAGYVDATRSFNLGPAGYTTPANDGYKRLQLSQIVRINNPAGQRETP